MIVDYEMAWVRLAEYVASKTQHGREGLLQHMAHVAAESRVPAGELSRLLRLYGIEVERARAITDLADGVDSDGDAVPGGIAASRGIIDQIGDHDGSITEGSSNGRARPVAR